MNMNFSFWAHFSQNAYQQWSFISYDLIGPFHAAEKFSIVPESPAPIPTVFIPFTEILRYTRRVVHWLAIAVQSAA